TGVHIPCEKRQSITGTVRYCSMHTHNGADQSRRDDMEAVGYVLVYLLKGYLPWQGVRGNTRAEKQEAIGVMKNTIDLRQQLCTNMPDEFAIYLEYVRGLAFDQEPDYRYCRKLFRQAFAKENYIKDYIFEWNFLRQQQNQGDNAQQSAPNKQLQDDDGSMEESVLNARTLTYAPTQAPTVVEQERSAKRDLEREKKLKDQIICLQSECQRMKDYCQEHPNLKEATFRYEHLLQDKAKLQDQLSKLMQSNIIVVGGAVEKQGQYPSQPVAQIPSHRITNSISVQQPNPIPILVSISQPTPTPVIPKYKEQKKKQVQDRIQIREIMKVQQLKQDE
ncbi:MAG: putative casein kinase 1, partial [Streblomastix strix]